MNVNFSGLRGQRECIEVCISRTKKVLVILLAGKFTWYLSMLKLNLSTCTW